MNLLVSSGGPSGALWHITNTASPQLQRIADSPETSFVLPINESRVIALCGHDEGILRLFEITEPNDNSSDHKLHLTTEIPSGGGEPCFAAPSPDGHMIAVVNYGPPNVRIFSVNEGIEIMADLEISGTGSNVVPDRQEASHPHHALFLDNEHLIVCDLGNDSLVLVRIHNDGVQVLRNIATPPGSGPRHAAVVGQHIVVTAELSNEVLIASLAEILEPNVDVHWNSVAASEVITGSARMASETPSYPSDLIAQSDNDALVLNRVADTVTHIRIENGTASRVRETELNGQWPLSIMAVEDSHVIVFRDSDAVVIGNQSFSIPQPTWVAQWEVAR